MILKISLRAKAGVPKTLVEQKHRLHSLYFPQNTLMLTESRLHSLYFPKAPTKRSQHANATCRNIVGRNMLRAFGHRVAMCCGMLGVVGSNLKMVKFEPTTPNMSQHGGQTHPTCCAQQCCDMLRWHVAIVWPGLKNTLMSRGFPRCKNLC